MSRILLWVGLLVLLVGALFWLAGRDIEQPQQRIEKPIPENAIGR